MLAWALQSGIVGTCVPNLGLHKQFVCELRVERSNGNARNDTGTKNCIEWSLPQQITRSRHRQQRAGLILWGGGIRDAGSQSDTLGHISSQTSFFLQCLSQQGMLLVVSWPPLRKCSILQHTYNLLCASCPSATIIPKVTIRQMMILEGSAPCAGGLRRTLCDSFVFLTLEKCFDNAEQAMLQSI